MLPADTRAALEQRLTAFETSTGTQLVVATVPSLEGYPVDDYANGLFRTWKLGAAKVNNGVLLLVAPTERRVRVEVGYGLEARLNDALAGRIIQREVVPRFRAGDMPGGIVAGADGLIAQLSLPDGEARANVVAASAQPRQARSEGGGIGGFGFLAVIVVWLLISGLRGSRGRRHRGGSGIGNAILWGVASSMLSGGRSGGFGGGGFGGGGGFSGGGGSSGGGGASGSW